MVITDFKDKYKMYDKMEIWEISSLDDFFKAHNMLYEIFEKEYGLSFEKRNEPDKKFNDSNVAVITKLLNYFGESIFLYLPIMTHTTII